MPDLTSKHQNYVSALVDLAQRTVELMQEWEQRDAEWGDLGYLDTITQDDLGGTLTYLTPTDLANLITAYRVVRSGYLAQRVNFFKALP